MMMTVQEEYELARKNYHTMSNAWARWGIEHYVHKFTKSRGWYIEGTGLTHFPTTFKTKKAAVAQVELSVPMILQRLRKEMLKLEAQVDHTEYCCECRKYHDPPTWEPGQPCGR
jgi:hypothetical protein